MKLLPIPPTSPETEHEKHNAADNLGATTNSADLYEAWDICLQYIHGYLDNQLQHNGITQLRTVTVTQLVNALEKIRREPVIFGTPTMLHLGSGPILTQPSEH